MTKQENPDLHSLRRVIRVRKQDSAFVYFVLEANEGVMAYSTLPSSAGDAHRDLELMIPPSLGVEADQVLESISGLFVELESDERTDGRNSDGE
jgi:hypothetical protein